MQSYKEVLKELMKELMKENTPAPEVFERVLSEDRIQKREERKRLRDSWKKKKQYPR